jgi:MFS family permease
LRTARAAVIAYFAILGMAEGVWVVHIPAAKARLHLSDGRLGVALLVGPAALVMVMPVAGRLADRFGSSGITRPVGVVVAFLPVILGSVRTIGMLLAGLLAFGVAGGLLAVSINAQGVLVERAYRRPLMASFHASYSLGGLSGAVTGGILAWVRAGPVTACLVAALPSAVAAAAAGRWLLAESALARHGRLVPDCHPAAECEVRRPSRSRPSRSRPSRSRPSRSRPSRSRPSRSRPSHGAVREAGSGRGLSRVVALGLLALCSVVGEGTAGNWSAIYLRDDLRAPSGLAMSGFAAFSVAMTVGRLLGDRLAARFGPVRLVRGCGLLAATSLAAGLASNEPVGAVAGFALFGAGLSCVVPQLLSAAGNADPDQPGTGLARVAGLGYIGLVGGPVLIGACAALTGLPVALGIPVVLGLCVAASAGVLDPLRLLGKIPPGQAADVALALTTGALSTGALTTATLIAEALTTQAFSAGALIAGVSSTGALRTGALRTGALRTGALRPGALRPGALSADAISVEAPGA